MISVIGGKLTTAASLARECARTIGLQATEPHPIALGPGPALDPLQATGQASADGVTLSWSISQGRILITIIRKPWMIAYSAIWSHVDAVLG